MFRAGVVELFIDEIGLKLNKKLLLKWAIQRLNSENFLWLNDIRICFGNIQNSILSKNKLKYRERKGLNTVAMEVK